MIEKYTKQAANELAVVVLTTGMEIEVEKIHSGAYYRDINIPGVITVFEPGSVESTMIPLSSIKYIANSGQAIE